MFKIDNKSNSVQIEWKYSFTGTSRKGLLLSTDAVILSFFGLFNENFILLQSKIAIHLFFLLSSMECSAQVTQTAGASEADSSMLTLIK